MTKTEENKIITQIIKSFNDFGLGDIRHNTNKPIAAFILCACFIDQIASYLYWDAKNQETKWELFIEKYLPQYEGLNLYANFRCRLLHEYSLREIMMLTSDKLDFKIRPDYKNISLLQFPTFIIELEKMFKKFKKDIKTVGKARSNALKWHQNHPVLKGQNYSVTLYTENDANTLINYYNKIISPLQLPDTKDFIFISMEKELQKNGKYLILATWSNTKSQKFCLILQDAIKRLKISNKKIHPKT